MIRMGGWVLNRSGVDRQLRPRSDVADNADRMNG